MFDCVCVCEYALIAFAFGTHTHIHSGSYTSRSKKMKENVLMEKKTAANKIRRNKIAERKQHFNMNMNNNSLCLAAGC